MNLTFSCATMKFDFSPFGLHTRCCFFFVSVVPNQTHGLSVFKAQGITYGRHDFPKIVYFSLWGITQCKMCRRVGVCNSFDVGSIDRSVGRSCWCVVVLIDMQINIPIHFHIVEQMMDKHYDDWWGEGTCGYGWQCVTVSTRVCMFVL